MKKIVCFISIIIIIIFIGDYYNSKYARGVFFEHHFISDNVMIFRMGSNTGYYTGYYTYFAKEENSSIDKNILHQLFDYSPASMPIFGMTECTNLGIHDSTIVGYSLLDNKLILSVKHDSLLSDFTCSIDGEEIKFSDTNPQYNTTNDNLPFIVSYWRIILLILFLILTIVLMVEIKTYSLFFYFFVVSSILLRLILGFGGHLWILENFFHYIIQAVYLLSLPIMIFRAYKKKEIGIIIPTIILNIIFVIYMLI